MYDELDFYLKDYDTDNDAVLNYWYDAGFKDVTEILEEFTDTDWEELLENIDNKSDVWKERLVYCLEDKDKQYQVKLLEKLLKTKDNSLFLQVINTLRTSFDVNTIGDKEEIIKKINLLLPESDQFTTKAYLDYIDKANSGKHKL